MPIPKRVIKKPAAADMPLYRVHWTTADPKDPTATTTGEAKHVPWFDAVSTLYWEAIDRSTNHDHMSDERKKEPRRLFIQGSITRESDNEVVWLIGYTTTNADHPIAMDAKEAGHDGRGLMLAIGDVEGEGGEEGDTEDEGADEKVSNLGKGQGKRVAARLSKILGIGQEGVEYDEVMVTLRNSKRGWQSTEILAYSDDAQRASPLHAALELSLSNLTLMGTRSVAMMTMVLEGVRRVALLIPNLFIANSTEGEA
jgi:hypothetical protein